MTMGAGGRADGRAGRSAAGLFINHDLAVTKCDILDKRDGIYKESGTIHFDRRQGR